MSEAPTHAAVPTPTPARPQQTERTAQTERQAERGTHTERHAEDRTTQTEQRTQHSERTPQQSEAQRTEHQRTDAQRIEPQRNESQRNDTQRNEAQRAEQRAETQRTEHHAEQRTSNKLEDEWQAVQYEFVDDPKAAVRKADGLVTRALEELTSRHRSLTKQLEGSGDPQTEDLRLALHRYRELFKSLVAVK